MNDYERLVGTTHPLTGVSRCPGSTVKWWLNSPSNTEGPAAYRQAGKKAIFGWAYTREGKDVLVQLSTPIQRRRRLCGLV